MAKTTKKPAPVAAKKKSDRERITALEEQVMLMSVALTMINVILKPIVMGEPPKTKAKKR